MSQGFCYLAQHGRGISLKELKSSLNSIGVRLANPSSHAITIIKDEGDQVQVSEESLAESLESTPVATVQFWLSDSTDVCFSIRPVAEGLTALAFGLDGLSKIEVETLCGWALRRFSMLAASNAAALLVEDIYGVTSHFDWDLFVRRQSPLPTTLPEVLGFDRRLVQLPQSEFTGRKTRTQYNCCISFDPTFRIGEKDE